MSATVKLGAVAAVMLSVLELPVSEPATRSGVPPLGAVVSRVKVSEAEPVLPKASVWLATMVWAPSASPLGVNDQAPCALAVTVARTAVPSMVKCTSVLASPVPLSAGLEVMWSVAELPVSTARLSVTVGAAVLSV